MLADTGWAVVSGRRTFGWAAGGGALAVIGAAGLGFGGPLWGAFLAITILGGASFMGFGIAATSVDWGCPGCDKKQRELDAYRAEATNELRGLREALIATAPSGRSRSSLTDTKETP